MTDLVISPELAEKITRIAEQAHSSVESLLTRLVTRYEIDTSPGRTFHA